MMAHAVGQPAAEQHAARRAEHEHDQAERRVALADAEHRVERRHGELLDADSVGRDQGEEGQAQQDRGLQEQRPRRELRRRGSARLDAMVDQVGAMRPHQDRQHEARHRADQRRRDVADRAVEEVHRRPAGPAQRAAQPVDAEGAAEPLGIDRGVEDREVGRMEHRVAEPAQHRDRGELRERMRYRHESHRAAHCQQAAGQDRPRAEAVDREARRRLAEARHCVEQRAEDADLLEAQADPLAHDQQHRHEGELVVVARPVGDADQADDAQVAADGDGGSGHAAPL